MSTFTHEYRNPAAVAASIRNGEPLPDPVQKSKGHLFFFEGKEYFDESGVVYSANADTPLDIYGYRHGMFACYLSNLEHYKTLLGKIARGE